ncbi:MAG: cyclic pyranopterin monophosphate synthase MoaC [Pseudomonadota bacterium]
MSDLTHFNKRGEAVMVDVSAKPSSERRAVAEAKVAMQVATLKQIRSGTNRKGDVLGIARLAGIMAAKRTSELIPLCHPLPLEKVELDLELDENLPGVVIRGTCTSTGKTGVEMEALTAVTIAALTIYDMCKAIDRGMMVQETRLLEKSGGKSGDFSASSA